jgi:type II secretory pathway component PulF
MAEREARNPFSFLLIVASVLLVVTALALSVVPVLEQKAAEASHPPPAPTGLRLALHENGWRWLLYEAGGVAVFGVASMVLDRLRSLKKERRAARIAPVHDRPTSTDS